MVSTCSMKYRHGKRYSIKQRKVEVEVSLAIPVPAWHCFSGVCAYLKEWSRMNNLSKFPLSYLLFIVPKGTRSDLMWDFQIKKPLKIRKKTPNFCELSFVFKLKVTVLTKTSNGVSESLPVDFVVSLRNSVWFCLVLGLFSQILALNLGDLII